MKEFITAVEEVVAEDEGTPVEEQYVEFKMGEQQPDGTIANERVLRAYQPHPGQLTFMLAALGRGQTEDKRFAAIVNIIMETLRDEDQDYFESRMLTRDKKKMLKMKQIEEIFEFLIEEWFANPTQQSSDSA